MVDDLKPKSVQSTATRVVDTPIGNVVVVANAVGVTSVEFDVEDINDVAGVDAQRDTVAESNADRAAEQLREYFAGKRTTFDVPLAATGTRFQAAAWAALCRIPFGNTISYKEQAMSMGKPTATRAVGAANGRNPIAVIVPCHRVIGADGSLTGYASGVDRKVWLLDHERRHSAIENHSQNR